MKKKFRYNQFKAEEIESKSNACVCLRSDWVKLWTSKTFERNEEIIWFENIFDGVKILITFFTNMNCGELLWGSVVNISLVNSVQIISPKSYYISKTTSNEVNLNWIPLILKKTLNFTIFRKILPQTITSSRQFKILSAEFHQKHFHFHSIFRRKTKKANKQIV